MLNSSCSSEDNFRAIQEELAGSEDSCLLAIPAVKFWEFCCGVAEGRKQAGVGTRPLPG